MNEEYGNKQFRKAGIFACAALATLAETGGGPEGHIYAALMGSLTLDAALMGSLTLGDFQRYLGILKSSGLITCKGHYVTPTATGKALGDRINNVLDKISEVLGDFCNLPEDKK